MMTYAYDNGIMKENSIVYKDLFDTKLMGCLVNAPSVIRARFKDLYDNESSLAATDYFYKLSCDSNYIRRQRIKKDRKWTTDTEFGTLDITINLSKPEKDPKAIAAAKNATATKNNVTITATKAGAQYDTTNTVTASATGSEGIVVTGDAFALTLKDTTSYTATQVNDILKKGGADYQVSFDGTQTGTALATALSGTALAGGSGIAGGGLTLQVGDTNESYNKVMVSVGDMSAEGLGIADLDVSTQDAAGAAISTIKTAINTVSTNRGNLGALQNRLEHAISNLDTTSENMSSANSAIRDTDMAKEMMNYTKMNILSQAAQAMLAQANQQPQNILQLLK